MGLRSDDSAECHGKSHEPIDLYLQTPGCEMKSAMVVEQIIRLLQLRIEEVNRRINAAGYNECQRLANALTSGNICTSATNFASNGDTLSFRQMRASGNGRFKSVTGRATTLSGHRQRVALLTNATPNLHDTRLRMVASFTASWTMCGDLRPPRKHSCINRS